MINAAQRAPLLAPGAALAIVLERVSELGIERLVLDNARGHVLAHDVLASRDLPPADRATMDGYALQAEDTASLPVALHIAGEVAAGSDAAPRVVTGNCARIFTGANLPPGADAVVMVEETALQPNDTVAILSRVAPGASIATRGSVARAGEVLLQSGLQLDAGRLAVCAAAGAGEVEVFRRASVSVLSTGAELRDAGEPVRSHEAHDSNGPLLRAALAEHAFPVLRSGIVPDDLALIAEWIQVSLALSDAVIVSGGVSVSDYDLVPAVARRLGATIHVHGVAMRPGKPFLFATAPGGKPLFGLPGNPLSALTCLHEFVLPALRRMSGIGAAAAQSELCLPAPRDLAAAGARDCYVPARLQCHSGSLCVELLEAHGSADVVAAGCADGAVIVPVSAGAVAAGTPLEFRPWRRLP